MTPRDNSRYDDQAVIQYLLGDMPEAEAEHLDELSVVDDEFAVRLTAAENDLVDAYVRGELADGTRDRFQSHYLCSQRRRERVKFAESLMLLADRAVVPAAAGGRARGRLWPRLFPVFAAAACLLLMAGLLIYQNFRLRTQLLRTEQERAALERRERDARSQIEKQNEKSNPPPSERSAIAIAIVLSPPTRGIGSPPAIAIPAETSRADFRLEFESADFAEYRVRLKTPASKQVLWQSAPVRPLSHDGISSVSVGLPGTLLKPRHYVLELSGISPRGTLELLSSYAFTVVP